MYRLEHRVRVFVFQVLESETRFLLLRHKPREEWPLGPVVGSVGLDEHLDDSIVREVREETGIQRPVHIIDLSSGGSPARDSGPAKELFGDIGLVEWPFAYQAGTPDQPVAEVRPGPKVGEYVWLNFEEAFARIETARDRDSLVRLRLDLG